MSRAVLRSGGLRVEVDAEGARIVSILHLRSGREILATTPWADAPPDRLVLDGSSVEWHRRYPGGWHVLLPRAGDPPRGGDPRQPFHGEAAWRTWTMDADARSCRTRVQLRTVPLEITRRVIATDDALVVDTAVHNPTGARVHIGWAEHPAFDGSLFDGAHVHTGDRRIAVPPSPSSGFDDLAGDAGRLIIDSPAAGLRLELEWDPERHPRVYVWRERRGSTGYPWWGQVDAVGLEPASDRYASPVDALGSVEVPAGATVSSRVRLRIADVDAATA